MAGSGLRTKPCHEHWQDARLIGWHDYTTGCLLHLFLLAEGPSFELPRTNINGRLHVAGKVSDVAMIGARGALMARVLLQYSVQRLTHLSP